jgi:hypothetical protein
MALVKMLTFGKPSLRSRSVIACKVAPALRGAGMNDYACGGCGDLLARNIAPGQLQLIAFKCFVCGKYSEPPSEPPASGNVVFFPVGIYRTTDTIYLAANVIAQGERIS